MTAVFMVISVIGDFIVGIVETIFNTIFGQSTGDFLDMEIKKTP